MSKEQLIKDINNLRKTNKNNWYYLDTTYNNKAIQIKGIHSIDINLLIFFFNNRNDKDYLKKVYKDNIKDSKLFRKYPAMYFNRLQERLYLLHLLKIY